jgi:hypothetical protein
MNSRIGKVLVAAALCFTAVGGSSWADAAAVNDDMTSLPNPIVEYTTYRDLRDKVGFEPLIIPKIVGYKCTRLAAIGGDLAEMDYGNNNGVSFAIRTSKASDAGDNEDISGIYGARWTRRQMGSTTVYIAKVGQNSYAGHWKSGDYAFSVSSDHVTEVEFMRVLSSALVDLTEHYYGSSVTLDSRRAYF